MQSEIDQLLAQNYLCIDNKEVAEVANVVIEKENDGIITIFFNNDKYTFWHNANVVLYHVQQFLKGKFPDDIIIDEFNKTDFVVLGQNLPIEIQSTVIAKSFISHSGFEKMTEKQIRENIERYEACWFFFDAEYLRYLQNLANDATRGIKINLDWLYRFIKEEKLRVFTVSYDGIIKELTHKDFDFLVNISISCKIGKDKDFRKLDRNKFKIMHNVLKGHGFTTEEYSKYRNNFFSQKGNNTNRRDSHFDAWLKREGCTDREHLLGYIIDASYSLELINDALDLSFEKDSFHGNHIKKFLKCLGLFDIQYERKNMKLLFIDKFDIASYFPGYLRNIDVWKRLRSNYVTSSTLCSIMKKEIDYFWWEKLLTKA